MSRRAVLTSRVSTLATAATVVAGLTALPIIVVAVQLFAPGAGAARHLFATVLGEYAENTIFLAIGTAIGVGLIGTGTAWLVVMCRFRGRAVLEWALVLPLAVPSYVLAYTYTDFLQVAGPLQSSLRGVTGWHPRDYWFPEVRSLGGAVAMFALALYPYVYLLARAAFLDQSVCVIEVSRTLGAGPWRTFARVALPLARPAIAAGIALALMEVLADFGTVAYFGVPTFTTGIYRAWFSMGDSIGAAQMSTILLACVTFLVLLERRTRGRARFHPSKARSSPLPSYRLHGLRGLAAASACALPLVLGFLLPGAILLRMALFDGDAQWGDRYLQLAKNSVLLASVASVVTVAAATLLAYAVRVRKSAWTKATVHVAGLGYAIPGSVIAVGILIPFTAADNLLDATMRQQFGVSTGLLLTGTLVGLVIAYLVRFLAVALQGVGAGLEKVTPAMDAAASSLGAGPGRALLQIHMPLLAGSLFTALLIVFVEVVKELPATLLLRPFNFDTLAVQAYHLAMDERLSEASTAALTVVAVSLLPVIALSRAIAGARAGLSGPAGDPLADGSPARVSLRAAAISSLLGRRSSAPVPGSSPAPLR